MNKIILNLCPTGVIPTKNMNSSVPLSPDEIAKDVFNCYQEGIQIVHIHARDEHEENTLDKDRYCEIIFKIREKCPDIIICVSLSGRVINTYEARSDVLNLQGKYKPDMGSLTLSSMNFVTNASINSPKMIVDLLTKMNEEGIKPELEVFDVGMVNYAKYLIQKGLLKPPYYFNIILGNLFSAQNNPADLSSIIQALPPNSFYTLGGIGNYQLGSNIAGILYASGVRIGLEDNIYYDSLRKEKATNLSLVKRIISVCDLYERPRYTCQELRELLQIPLKTE
jgi:3-keto-5-aminohexanoate cleavage enzyme